MTLYANSPPFTDMSEYFPSTCKGLEYLQTCWSPIVKVCPGNMTDFLTDVILFHHLVCKISASNLSHVFVTRWADAFKLKSVCQIVIQLFINVIIGFDNSNVMREVALGTLNCMMLSQNITITETSKHDMDKHDEKFNKILKIMSKFVLVLNGNIDLGLAISDIDVNLFNLITHVLYDWITNLLEVFWVGGGFVSYDPWHPPRVQY